MCLHSQQNGVAERMNRTILEKVRSMLSDSGLSRMFWAEATQTAVTLINKTPSSTIKFEIPNKKWTVKSPVYSYLRRFGCVCFSHTNDGKLSPRANKAVLLGYPSGVKGYKVWLLEEKKCQISRNVIFQENDVYKDVIRKGKQKEDDQHEATEMAFDIDLGEGGDIISGGDIQSDNEVSEDDQHEVENQETGDQNAEHDHDSENDQVQEEETSESPESYHLIRDKEHKTVRATRRFDIKGYFSENTDDEEDCFDAEVLVTTVDGDLKEPSSYREARDYEDWEF